MANILVPRRREDFFNPDGTFTLRALRFFEGLTDVTNESSTIIVDNSELINKNTKDITELQDSHYPSMGTYIQFLQQQLDGLPVFTVDTTGFTTDTTLITADKVIA